MSNNGDLATLAFLETTVVFEETLDWGGAVGSYCGANETEEAGWTCCLLRRSPNVLLI